MNSAAPLSSAPLGELLRRRFLIIGGKGGVGRTTVAAALALLFARRGRRVLLAQANAKERLSRLLGGPVVGTDLVRMRDKLWAVNMTPRAALREYGLMVLRYKTVSNAVLENRMVKYFLHAIPGLDEYAMLGKAWFHTTEEAEAGAPRWDTVLLDGPATGHLLAMLRIPQAILDAVPEGPLTRDARQARDLLGDPSRTSMIIATLAEDLPANEAAELYRAAAEGLGISVGPLVVNQVFPDRFGDQSAPGRVLAALEGTSAAEDPVLGPPLRRAATARNRRQLNERYLAKLAAEVPRPQVRLPFLFTTDFGADEVEMLSRLLEEELAR